MAYLITTTSRSAPNGHKTGLSDYTSVSVLRGSLRKLALVFGLLALIPIGVNLKFIWDSESRVQQKSVTSSIGAANIPSASETDQKEFPTPQRNRLFVLLAISACAFAGIIYLYLKLVVVPLDSVAQAAREIAKGNFKVTAPANPAGQIGELAETINDLSANFQEVLLLTGTVLANSREALDEIEDSLGHEAKHVDDELRRQIVLIREDLQMLDSVVKEFNFYQVRFDGRKVLHDGRRRSAD
jgi:HAMP domain-containing protein